MQIRSEPSNRIGESMRTLMPTLSRVGIATLSPLPPAHPRALLPRARRFLEKFITFLADHFESFVHQPIPIATLCHKFLRDRRPDFVFEAIDVAVSKTKNRRDLD